MRPVFCNSIFPDGKNGFRGDEGKETVCVFCFFEQCSDNVFFMRVKGNTDSMLFDSPGKGLDGKVLHEKDAHEAFSVGNDEEHEGKKVEEEFDNRHKVMITVFFSVCQ